MPDHDVVNPETQREKSDVNVRALLWAVVIFVIFAALYNALAAWLGGFEVEIKDVADASPTPGNLQ